jgi:hypothetical protein
MARVIFCTLQSSARLKAACHTDEFTAISTIFNQYLYRVPRREQTTAAKMWIGVCFSQSIIEFLLLMGSIVMYREFPLTILLSLLESHQLVDFLVRQAILNWNFHQRTQFLKKSKVCFGTKNIEKNARCSL